MRELVSESLGLITVDDGDSSVMSLTELCHDIGRICYMMTVPPLKGAHGELAEFATTLPLFAIYFVEYLLD
jgi:hypothetical protein